MELANARYFNLATYRRDGRAVETPVWFAADGATFYLFSAGDAGKVKRLRNSGRARIAACDGRGRLRGDWHDAQARIVTGADEVARAHRALRRKYGFQMRLTDLFSTLAGRYHKRAFIAVQLDHSAELRRAT